MTTKTIQNRKKPKEAIPSGYYTIRDAINFLKKFDIKISYDGLSYYRKLGIIDDPLRFKGHMNKFYEVYSLLIKILTAKLLTAFLNIKLEDLSKYTKKLPSEIYLQLPSIILKTYETVWGFKYDIPVKRYRGVTNLYGTLYIGMRGILDETVKQIGEKISLEKFSELLEKEARRYKKTAEQKPGYKALLEGL